MRTVFAALPARRPFPVACMAALAVPSASADPDPTDIHPLDARVLPHGAPSPTTITTNSDSSLTAVQTTQTVTITTARGHAAFDAVSSGAVATIGRERSTAPHFVAAEEALKYASSLPIRKRFTCDCNSVFAARGFKASQTLRGLDCADCLLLSDPHVLSVTYLPRGSSTLQMSRISRMPPGDNEHVEVQYVTVFAPSAGNAIGASVRIATAHEPRKLDVSFDTQCFRRHYDAPYGFAKTPVGAYQAVHVGDPIARFAYQPALDRRLGSDSPQSQYASPNSSYNAKPCVAVPVPEADNVKSGGSNDTIAWTTSAPQIEGEPKWSR
jgi:hypothetical protein